MDYVQKLKETNVVISVMQAAGVAVPDEAWEIQTMLMEIIALREAAAAKVANPSVEQSTVQVPEQGGYIPVDVEAARGVAQKFGRDVVVIVAYDHASKLVHVTTYGKSADDKLLAAGLGEILAKAAGVDVAAAKTFEDFRGQGAAANAADAEELRRITTLHLPDEWHEDFGDVLWWRIPDWEAPYCGSPLDSDWPGPGHYTHWSKLPKVQEPKGSVERA